MVEEEKVLVEIALKYYEATMTAVKALVDERSNLTLVFVPLYFTVLGISSFFSPIERTILYLISMFIICFWYFFVARIDSYLDFYFKVSNKIEEFLDKRFQNFMLLEISPEHLFEKEFREEYGKTKKYSKYTKIFSIVFLIISTTLILLTLLLPK